MVIGGISDKWKEYLDRMLGGVYLGRLRDDGSICVYCSLHLHIFTLFSLSYLSD